MSAEDFFLQKYGNKITASESWVIRFADEYAKIKIDNVLFSFFLWFRANGQLYIDKSIEDMINIYKKENEL